MGYEQYDPILIQWATDRGLRLDTSYQDTDVRSFEIVSSSGKRFQIWVEPADRNNQVAVKVWDFKKRNENFSADVTSLYETLEEARRVVARWSDQLD